LETTKRFLLFQQKTERRTDADEGADWWKALDNSTKTSENFIHYFKNDCPSCGKFYLLFFCTRSETLATKTVLMKETFELKRKVSFFSNIREKLMKLWLKTRKIEGKNEANK
jgi:hypothetical protein